ncbi:MAG: AAA family ATPase [Acidimicrobiales bacterium]
MASHPDLQAEQAYIDRAYDRLEAMRRAAEDLRDSVIGASRGGTHQARVERDVFVQASLARLEQLQLGRASLCFGRIDRTDLDATTGDRARPVIESFYIGRLAVSDDTQEPLVVDWRAPVAEAFYRATGRSSMGLRRRRHFAAEGRTLLGIEDELFGSVEGLDDRRSPHSDGRDAGNDGLTDPDLTDPDLVGPGALLAALQRSRSGQMRDIVATVQREQDEIIRAELPGILVVQGGPGTGKTAVALHRAAYLLYTHRFPLEQQGVLVVGPNQLFLRYIEQVLPSLGESGVSLATIGSLLPHVRPAHVESTLAGRVKGDRRMMRVLANAVGDRERALRDDLVLGFGSLSLRVSAGTTRHIMGSVKRRPGTHNAKRRQVEGLLLRALHDQYLAAVARGRRTGLGGGILGSEGEELDARDFALQVRRDPSVVAALDRMWPVLTPAELLNDLFGAAPLLALATRGVLGHEERDALARPRARTLEEVPWTAADVPLLDEARALLGSARLRRRGVGPSGDEDDEVRGYGHIVVDEAQDLSPMALRMLGRRSISGSMTLVGDIGQATSALAPDSWDDVLVHLPTRRPPRIVELSVNYRTPAEIMEVAAEVLAAAAVPGVRPPRSVRATGRMPEARRVTHDALADAVAGVAAAEAAAVDGGTVAVIASSAALPALRDGLGASGIEWGEPERTGLSAPVTLLDVTAAKGLEFDSVIVVEPAQIAEEGGQGMRSLFVALTRPTRRLVAVHARDLPVALSRGLARVRATMTEGPAPVDPSTSVHAPFGQDPPRTTQGDAEIIEQGQFSFGDSR